MFTLICDCATKDAMLCRENPDCRPSYCKMTARENQKAVMIAGVPVVVHPCSQDSSAARGATYLAPLHGSRVMAAEDSAVVAESAFVQNGALIKPVDASASESPTTCPTDSSRS